MGGGCGEGGGTKTTKAGKSCRPGKERMSSIRPSAAVTGRAAGKLALAFRGLKALALRGECASHCSSYLPIRAFLIIASNPMLVLEFSWTDWLLQLINPGRCRRRGKEKRGGRGGEGREGEPNKGKKSGWGGEEER